MCSAFLLAASRHKSAPASARLELLRFFVPPLPRHYNINIAPHLSCRYGGDSLEQSPPATLGQMLTILKSGLEAIRISIGAGIVHRDIKIANMVWDESHVVRLIDYSLARHIKDPHTVAHRCVDTAKFQRAMAGLEGVALHFSSSENKLRTLRSAGTTSEEWSPGGKGGNSDIDRRAGTPHDEQLPRHHDNHVRPWPVNWLRNPSSLQNLRLFERVGKKVCRNEHLAEAVVDLVQRVTGETECHIHSKVPVNYELGILRRVGSSSTRRVPNGAASLELVDFRWAVWCEELAYVVERSSDQFAARFSAGEDLFADVVRSSGGEDAGAAAVVGAVAAASTTLSATERAILNPPGAVYDVFRFKVWDYELTPSPAEGELVGSAFSDELIRTHPDTKMQVAGKLRRREREWGGFRWEEKRSFIMFFADFHIK